jgi:integrase
MNRRYIHRGREVPGVHQRCRDDCPPSGCKDNHAWRYIVELPVEPGGERRQEVKGGFATGAEAAAAREEVLRKHREGTLPRDGKLTVATWLRTWLTTQEEVRGLRDGTLIDYRRHIELYWIPLLGHLKLSDLRSRQITDALARIKRERDRAIREAAGVNAAALAAVEPENARRRLQGLKRMVKPKLVKVPRSFGPSTAQRVHATLRAALNAAVRAEEISRNVAVFAEVPRISKRKVKPWEPEELGVWLDTIAKHRLYALFHLGALGGLRRGELCGLSWDEVDLDAERLEVWWQITGISYRKARAAARRGELSSYRVHLKTADGEARILDLDNFTVEVLSAWRKQQIVERLAWGPTWSNSENLVFTRENGSPLDPDWVYKEFVRLVRRAGLRRRPLHHLRHGAASLQLAAGVDIAIVSKRLGHSKIDLTSDTYGHLIGKVGKQAAEASAALVPRRQTRLNKIPTISLPFEDL